MDDQEPLARLRPFLIDGPARLAPSFWTVALSLWVLVLTFLSLSSGPSLSHSSALSFLWNLAHAPMYGLLAPLLLFALPRQEGAIPLDLRSFAFSMVFVLAVGAGNEWLQSLAPGRVSSLWDLLSDAAGGASLVGMLWLFRVRAPKPFRFFAFLAAAFLACASPAWFDTFAL